MKNANPVLAAALIALSYPCAVLALDGGDILKVPPTARGLSLGGSEVCTGTEALFYNPSGLAAATRMGVSLSHAQLYEETRLDSIGASAPTALGSLGVSALLLTQGALEGRDMDGRATGSFLAVDRVVSVSWAAKVPRSPFRLGFTAKHLEQRIADAKAQGMLADLGLQAQVGSRLSVGASAQNLGKRLQFLSESFAPPLAVGVSAGLDLGGGLGLLARVRHRPNAALTELGGGMEFSLGGVMALRASIERPFSSALPASQNPLLSGFSGGVGLLALKGTQLDYAFSPGVEALGQTHRLTLRFEFGGADDGLAGPRERLRDAPRNTPARRGVRSERPRGGPGTDRPRKQKQATWDNFWRRDGEGRPL
ncbi:MAG: hypothetical protein HY554_16660 [Elusimicrobia bacterium]|nr:hypothetical protein [Elusimicrobiota bacterium]